MPMSYLLEKTILQFHFSWALAAKWRGYLRSLALGTAVRLALTTEILSDTMHAEVCIVLP